MISRATELTGLVARLFVGERVARHSCGRRRHRRRWLRSRSGRRGHRACRRRCHGGRGSRCRRGGRRKCRRGSRDPSASAPDGEQGHERRRGDLRISHNSLAYNHAMMFRQGKRPCALLHLDPGGRHAYHPGRSCGCGSEGADRAHRVPDGRSAGGSRSLPDNTAGIATWLDARKTNCGGDLTRKRSLVRILAGKDGPPLVGVPSRSFSRPNRRLPGTGSPPPFLHHDGIRRARLPRLLADIR